MMNILETKGHLKREPGEKAHVYSPVRPQQIVVRSMVREFVNRVFDGSARPLLVHLLQGKRPHRSRAPRAAKAARQGGVMTVSLWTVAAYALQLAALVTVAVRRDVAAADPDPATLAAIVASGAGDRAAPAAWRNRASRTVRDCRSSPGSISRAALPEGANSILPLVSISQASADDRGRGNHRAACYGSALG
jgi:hypothetical protein